MKHPLQSSIIALISLSCLVAHSQSESPADSVTMKEGLPHVQTNGEWAPLEKELALTSSIKVQTNGTFTVNDGKPRPLKDGQILKKDGYLANPDGTTAPVFDRITVDKIGHLTLHQDGVSSRLNKPFKFPDGSTVYPNGTLHMANGQTKRLIDGQMLRLNGASLETKDTVTIQEGTVFVQKDGARYKVEPNRTFMMNDGSKVFGSGKVVKRDGSEITLQEGEVLTLPGIVNR